VAGLATSFGSGAMTNPISDLEQAGALFVIGSNTTEAHPIAALAITYIFAIMVVTANAQQDAIARMKADQLPYGFSSAYILVEQAEKLAPAVENGEWLTQVLDSGQRATREGSTSAAASRKGRLTPS
jgi:NADH dehydrogenase/NADH:ubiquinone oxidoreductase subunit G